MACLCVAIVPACHNYKIIYFYGIEKQSNLCPVFFPAVSYFQVLIIFIIMPACASVDACMCGMCECGCMCMDVWVSVWEEESVCVYVLVGVVVVVCVFL